MKSLKAHPNEIYKWLIECNMDKLNQTYLEQLEKYLPEDKILAQYQELKENIDDLDSSEQFLVVVSSFYFPLYFTQASFLNSKTTYWWKTKISKIKGLRKRLKSLIFKCKFPEQQEEIKINLVAGTQACLDVKSSEKFQKLLEILLFVGNFMNSGSSNLEGSFGFDMKYLPKVTRSKIFIS